MNKPERIDMALDKKAYDLHQKFITADMRALEACMKCCVKESEALMESHPELFSMIRCAFKEAGSLHYNLSKLQKQIYADGGLTADHLDNGMPWLDPDGNWTMEKIATASGGCK